jgi:hypothetical protein
MRKLLISAVTAGLLATALMLAIPSIGAADPKPPVGAHRHFIQTPDRTLVPVGPDLCDNADDPAVQQPSWADLLPRRPPERLVQDTPLAFGDGGA